MGEWYSKIPYTFFFFSFYKKEKQTVLKEKRGWKNNRGKEDMWKKHVPYVVQMVHFDQTFFLEV
jgi:hypothetical protein